MPKDSGESTCDLERTLLHKCLAQFTRQQQIHAQQAAHYLHGFGDSMKSHETIPMMSSLLLDLVTGQNQPDKIEDISHFDNDKGISIEPAALSIQTDQSGKLLTGNQLLDYLYRSDALQDMNFYEFCCCVRLKKIKGDLTDVEPQLSKIARHPLKLDHPLHNTHQLV